MVTNNYKENNALSPKLERLTAQEMEERRKKGLGVKFDNKYIKDHKCNVKKLFYINCEEEEGR